MKNLFLSFMLLFPANVVLAQDEPPTAKETRSIQQLIEDLGNDSYQIREKAHAALEKIGRPALKSLKGALKSADLEVSGRAQELIEKITGKKIEPKSKSKEIPSTPSLPKNGLPEEPFNPDDMRMMLDKLESFEDLSPTIKKTLDIFRKLLDDNKDGKATLGLDELAKIFEQFYKSSPSQPNQPSQPKRQPKQPKAIKSDIEKELGLELAPIDDTLRSHIVISPWTGPRQAEFLKQGLVVKSIDPKGHAFAQGLRKNDILIFIGDNPAPKTSLPGPQIKWDTWRNKAIIAEKTEYLESLRTKKLFIEVIRKGESCCMIEASPLPKKSADKNRDF